jgi:hypothetical protein
LPQQSFRSYVAIFHFSEKRRLSRDSVVNISLDSNSCSMPRSRLRKTAEIDGGVQLFDLEELVRSPGPHPARPPP